MNDDGLREGLNFHYRADINVRNDQLNLIKMSNNEKGSVNQMSLDRSLDSVSSTALCDYVNNTNRLINESLKENQYTNIRFPTRLSPRDLKKPFEPKQIIQAYNMLQIPINLQVYKLKGLDI